MASRHEKYPDTDTFKFHNANPKGRITTDCVTRAVCMLLDKSYEDTARDMLEFALETGYHPGDTNCIDLYLQSKGYVKKRQPRKQNNTKYTGREFCKIFDGECVANIGGGHTVYIGNKKVHDTWDSTGGCIGNYWIKE